MSEWSAWSRGAGIEYRHRWGWNPQDKRYAADVDAIFEMRNRNREAWHGAARSVDCARNVVSRGTDVVLRANETREVRFRTANCGTPQSPFFKPNVVRSVRID
jgi:hypothetical protein